MLQNPICLTILIIFTREEEKKKKRIHAFPINVK